MVSPQQQQQLVQSRGIYHGLPVYSENVRGLTAIITGANGISGHYMLRVLAESPERWTKIWCLSRRPPAIEGGLPANVEHIALDFLNGPVEIADVLKERNVRADYIFFFSYIQPAPPPGAAIWSNSDELVTVNTLLLTNFLGALSHANIKPKRFMLQTGAKNYGVHLGPVTVPNEEADPRVAIDPNFYYTQEDELWKWCAAASCGWNIAMPSFILGAVKDAAMNLAFPLAVYAAVSRHLGAPLQFPADTESWQMLQVVSSSMMNAYLEEWAVLTEEAKDQKFNAFDNHPMAWEKTWPRIAGWYGIEWRGPKQGDEGYKQVTTRHDPPPRGYGGPGKMRFQYTMSDWARRPEVKKAWSELAEQHDLVTKEFEESERIFGFLDGMVIRSSSMSFSSAKARS